MLEYPLALLIVPLYFICKKFCKIKKESLIFPNASLSTPLKGINLLEAAVVLLFAIALASPVKHKSIPLYSNGYDIITILDTSGSMAQNNKIQTAKSIILNFAKKRTNDRLGLVIFGNIAYIASPLTYDKKSFKEILDRVYVNIAGGKTALLDALFLSTSLFKRSNAKNKIIIVLTDGKDNMSITPKEVVLKKLNNIKVYSIGIGADADKAILKEISKNGRYFFVKNPNELKNVFKEIDKLEKSKIKKAATQTIRYYQYPLFGGIVLMLVYLILFRRSIWNF
ncbi:MAG: VWA domain-containing protein [Epsilonproteobacteria bacterium]|nr:VWA domain-containing protein [Campylobacterota bacterium]